MSKFDLRIEAILDGLFKVANDHGIELGVESAFDDPHMEDLSCIVRNVNTNDFGIISVHVKEYPDEPVVFFLFDSNLYQYCKMEGFDTNNMLKGFDNKVFIKTDMKHFFDSMLGIAN
tara:strand:- start:65 stop:415 length:351 start_codon:yes stop_codon:yes gene_type:complete